MAEHEMLACPVTGEWFVSEKVWESRLPDGQPIRYGQFRLHLHRGQECEWSYLVQPVEQPKLGFIW